MIEIIDDSVSEASFYYLQDERWREQRLSDAKECYANMMAELATCKDSEKIKELKQYIADAYEYINNF